MSSGRNSDPVLRSFLRAAAIAFALGAEGVPALADDDGPEVSINASAEERLAGTMAPTPASDRAGPSTQPATASMTLAPRWRGLPDPNARLRLLDARGHKLLQSPVHGRCGFDGLPAGPCTLLIKTNGRTTIHRIVLAAGSTTHIALDLDG